jgi:hypothetical protein
MSAWTAVEAGALEDDSFDPYYTMYACAKHAVEAIGMVTLRETAASVLRLLFHWARIVGPLAHPLYPVHVPVVRPRLELVRVL